MEEVMDWNRVQGSWKQLEGKVKAKWGKLTADDLTAINGRREQTKASSRNVMAWRKIRLGKKLTTGSRPRAFEPPPEHVTAVQHALG